jgi:hypothetical protein
MKITNLQSYGNSKKLQITVPYIINIYNIKSDSNSKTIYDNKILQNVKLLNISNTKFHIYNE